MKHSLEPLRQRSCKLAIYSIGGDRLMSLLHSWELNMVNPFDYLTELRPALILLLMYFSQTYRFCDRARKSKLRFSGYNTPGKRGQDYEVVMGCNSSGDHSL
jgi:hypothetical protein